MREAVLEAVRTRIEVVSTVPPISKATIGVRLGLLRLQRASRVPLVPGERLSVGCEVQLSSLCFCAGSPVPMSALIDATVVVGEMLDGDRLSFELAGKQVPGTYTLSTVLTSLFPLSEFRGQAVQQKVWLKRASRLELSAQVDPAEANAAMIAALMQERANAIEAEASEVVLAELGRRLEFSHDADSLRAHALTLWRAIDQPRLVALAVSDALQQRAQHVWCASTGVLEWASRQLIASRVLNALFEAKVLDVARTASDAEAALESVGVGAAALQKAASARAEQLYSSAVIIAARRAVATLPCVRINA